MIEAYAAGARALAVLASAHLIGITLFLLRARTPPNTKLREWEVRWRLTLPPAALLLLVALPAMLHAQACSVAGGFAGLDLALDLARNTAAGRLWCFRAGFAVLVLLASAAAARSVNRAAMIVSLLAAMATTAVGPLSGHAAGNENAAWLLPLHIAHLLALCAWLGALPAWIGLARTAARDPDPHTADYAADALRRFSRLAMVCMATIVISGVRIALAFVADAGDLLGTRYGLLLCAKLALLAGALVIADALRRKLLPQLDAAGLRAVCFEWGASKVRHEWLLALIILVLGATLAQTTPALHDEAHWWLPFRLSLEATWIDSNARIAVLLGLALSLFAVVLLALRARHDAGALRGFLVAQAIMGLAIVTWGLSVPAFPDTFARPPVPYLSLSIESGRSAFEANCTACHGPGGLGDGPLARTLRRPPANLSQPHTALHTPGDMYWWITHGMPSGPMPGFATVLDDEQRWDVVNFLRVFSQGFQARVLGPRIVKGRPWLGAPDFYYDAADGSGAQMKDLRGAQAALVVFTASDDPRSAARLETLRNQADPSFVLIAPQGEDVWQAYQFLTRTLADRGAPDRVGMPRRHVEFLVDRFGYVRARWIPTEDPAPWEAGSFDAHAQVAELSSEPQILPPPELHLH